jgi:hypothetical protein
MSHFISYGFITSNLDSGLLIHKTEAFFLAINVDNVILYSTGSPMMKNIMNTLKSKFEVTNLENFHWVLEIQIKFGKKDIELSQIAYINSILS